MLKQDEYDRVVAHCRTDQPCRGSDIDALLASFQELYRAHDAVTERFQTDTEGLLYDEDGNPRLEL
jgi:hypothetical protein